MVPVPELVVEVPPVLVDVDELVPLFVFVVEVTLDVPELVSVVLDVVETVPPVVDVVVTVLVEFVIDVVDVEDVTEVVVVFVPLFALAACIITSAAFSAMIMIGAWMKEPGILGKTDASTTRRPLTPLTSKLVFNTAIASSSAPIGFVHEA